jgi:hypothetical protein
VVEAERIERHYRSETSKRREASIEPLP